MDKIVFISPPITAKEMYGDLALGGSSEALMGLCYLAAVTRANRSPTKIVDAPALKINIDQTVETALMEKPKYIGITAVSLAIHNASAIAEKIKNQDPSIITILGGAHLTAVPEETMEKFPQFDIGVIGEGERTIIELLKSLEMGDELKQIKGLIFRNNGQLIRTERRPYIKNLDTLPMPAWDLLPGISKYYKPTSYGINRLPSFSLVTSRGCVHRCTFCDRSMFGNRFRTHSPEYILKMIKDLYFNYGIKDVRINDDEFMLSEKHLLKVCKLLQRENLDLTWSCLGRVDDVSEDVLREMKKAGCWQIRFGIESGSQKILDVIKKDIALEQVERAIKLARKTGIKTIGFFMMGLPLETEKTLKETIDFASRLPLDNFKINFFAPFPGSELYKEIDRYGVASKDWKDLHMHVKPTFIPHGLTEETLIKYNKLAFRKFYLRPRTIVSHIRRIKNFSSFFSLLRGGIALMKYLLKR